MTEDVLTSAPKSLVHTKVRNSYEAQLTLEERAQMYKLLRTPGVCLRDVRAQIPPWRDGPYKGRCVSTYVLSKIARRLRAEENTQAIAGAASVLAQARQEIKNEPQFADTPEDLLERIFTCIGQKILQQVGNQKEPSLDELDRLMRHQTQLLQIARFKRETCQIFVKWYKQNPVRMVLESDATSEAKVQALGKIIYNEDW